MNFQRNILLSTDSYKLSHFLQYPAATTGMFSYIEARKNNSKLPKAEGVVFFGLQAFIKEYLLTPITMEQIDEAEAIAKAHGEPFPRKAFEKIITQYGGYLPLIISAVKEGTHVPFGNVMATVECHDPVLFWLASYIETALLRAIWYPTTVCTISNQTKQIISRYLEETSDDPAGQLPFKLHDFGARGVSSGESASLGGMAHLVNFMGTDTVEALVAAKRYYGAEMAGYSIPAAEHSTITSWGRSREADAYRNMIQQFSKPGSIYAVVSDSYDIFNAVDNLWGGELKEEVIAGGGTLVVRPDSGDPIGTPVRVIVKLAEKFGVTFNSKGYRVLNNVRVIQGDGIGPYEIERILQNLKFLGFSADNIAFGMGGALLQQVNRDTFSFSQKCSAIFDAEGNEIEVYKDPVGGGKTSKRGVITLTTGITESLEHGSCIQKQTLVTKRVSELRKDEPELLEAVYSHGTLLRNQTFDEIRRLSNETSCSRVLTLGSQTA